MCLFVCLLACLVVCLFVHCLCVCRCVVCLRVGRCLFFEAWPVPGRFEGKPQGHHKYINGCALMGLCFLSIDTLSRFNTHAALYYALPGLDLKPGAKQLPKLQINPSHRSKRMLPKW